MQATEDWPGDDLAPGCLLLRLFWWAGDLLVDTLVRPGMVEIGLILLHGSIEMSLTQDQEEIEALPPHAAQKTLTDGIGLRWLIEYSQNLNPTSIRHSVEGISELVVVVTNQELRSLTERCGLPQLLGHPAIIRTSGHREMHQSARIQLDHNKDKDSPEEEVTGLQKVAAQISLA
jgi:hypothetical protein